MFCFIVDSLLQVLVHDLGMASFPCGLPFQADRKNRGGFMAPVGMVGYSAFAPNAPIILSVVCPCAKNSPAAWVGAALVLVGDP